MYLSSCFFLEKKIPGLFFYCAYAQHIGLSSFRDMCKNIFKSLFLSFYNIPQKCLLEITFHLKKPNCCKITE